MTDIHVTVGRALGENSTLSLPPVVLKDLIRAVAEAKFAPEGATMAPTFTGAPRLQEYAREALRLFCEQERQHKKHFLTQYSVKLGRTVPGYLIP